MTIIFNNDILNIDIFNKDLTQKAIAQILGIQQNSYSQIENGTNNIQIDHLVKLANFYNTSTDYLLGLTNEIKPYPRIK